MDIDLAVKVIGLIVVLGIVLAFYRIVSGKDNELEWWHLISTQSSKNGRQYADWNKIGKGGGVLLCVWMPTVYAYSDKMDAGGMALVLGVALAYLGWVDGYAATLRARRGTTETVTEPAGEPAGPQKITRTDTPTGSP